MALATTHNQALANQPWRDDNAVPHIRIENVRKMFDDFAAVDGVDLSIYRGELFSLLGASGCGKTTLLRMLAGFEVPSEGRILIDGADVSKVPPYERPVNMMFQSYALFPHMTVEDNVAFGLRQDGVPNPKRADSLPANSARTAAASSRDSSSSVAISSTVELSVPLIESSAAQMR